MKEIVMFEIREYLYCNSEETRKKIKRNEVLWMKNFDHNFCNLKGVLSPIDNFKHLKVIIAAISKEFGIWLRHFH